MSSAVIDAAHTIGEEVAWNSDGYICGVSYEKSKALSRQLGITMLSVREFMALAKREPRVASSQFGEWLTDKYSVDSEGRTLDSQGSLVQVAMARPAWFDLGDIDESGLPSKLSTSSSSGKWKFWTPGHTEFQSGAIRGFVTSSGTCSFDLGIPTFAKHPMLMIRECYRHKEPNLVRPIYNI